MWVVRNLRRHPPGNRAFCSHGAAASRAGHSTQSSPRSRAGRGVDRGPALPVSPLARAVVRERQAHTRCCQRLPKQAALQLASAAGRGAGRAAVRGGAPGVRRKAPPGQQLPRGAALGSVVDWGPGTAGSPVRFPPSGAVQLLPRLGGRDASYSFKSPAPPTCGFTGEEGIHVFLLENVSWCDQIHAGEFLPTFSWFVEHLLCARLC